MCGIKFGGLLLVFISLAVMIFSLLRKEEPFFNLRDIIKAHKQLIRGSEYYRCALLWGYHYCIQQELSSIRKSV